MNLEGIRRYWERAGETSPEGRITPTSRDLYLARLERENIIRHLQPTLSVLEIGCGDGAHTICYARAVRRLVGLDVARSLLTRAERLAALEQVANATFVQGSVLELRRHFAPEFDAVISQRCLINLADWSNQAAAIDAVHAVLREGGIFLVSEGFQSELDELNVVRKRLGLAPIEVVPFNRNLDRERFEAYVEERFETVERRDYGTYLFLSRILHPLAVQPREPVHDDRLNEVAIRIAEAVHLPDLERYSYNRFYALRKR